MDERPQPQPISWSLVTVFILLTIAIVLAGLFYYRNQQSGLEQAKRDQLGAIAGLKSGQIGEWLLGYSRSAGFLLADPFISHDVVPILSGGDTPEGREEVLAWMNALQKQGQYADVLLLSASGESLLSTSGAAFEGNSRLDDLIAQVLRTGQTGFSDLYRDEASGKIALDFVVPILDAPDAQQPPVGLLVLRIDPSTFLYPLVQSWPTASPSAESILARLEGGKVVFLSDPRFRSGAALQLSYPANAPNLPAAMAVRGMTGIVDGIDYRGVAVIADVRPVPNSPWYLITKVDQSEIYAPVWVQERIALAAALLVILAAGAVVRLLWRGREVRFYKQLYLTEVERRALSAHYEYLTKYANDIMLLMNEELKIIEVNDRALAAYGCSRDRLLLKNLRDLQPSGLPAEFSYGNPALDDPNGALIETVHLRENGSTFPVECSVRAIEIDGQKFYQAILRDITERKRAEQDLRESEKKFRLFYEQTPIAYQSLNEDGNLLDVNWAWLELLGYAREEVLGRHFADFMLPEYAQKFPETLRSFIAVGDLREEEIGLACKDGTQLFAGLNGRIGYDEEGRFKQAHCVLHDITQQKLTQERINRLNEELEQRVIERTTQLEAANKELEAFSYSVSHDLRAPLRAIDGFSRILLEEFAPQLDTEAQRYLQIVRDNAQSMSRLIDDLLAFSRLSRQPLKKQSVDPRELVDASLEMLKPQIGGREIQFNIGELPPVQADPALLKQVYINLLSNAIKFTRRKEQAVVEIGSLKEGERTLYYVRDNGVGFDMQYAPKLFGVFQRLHRVEDYEGTGVGLAIVQRIVARHGGRIWAEGAVDHGATFCFTLDGGAPPND